MSETCNNILTTTTMSKLLGIGVDRKRWKGTLKKVGRERFGGDMVAMNDALRKTGLDSLNERPRWRVRNGAENSGLSLTANTIRQRVQKTEGLGLSSDDAQELSIRWAFSRLKSSLRDGIRFATPSRFARFATLISGEPVPVIRDPSLMLVARVAHQLKFGWKQFHNIAMSEHLYDCWAASCDEWRYLLDRDHPASRNLGIIGIRRSVSDFGKAIECAHEGLVNGAGISCLWGLENIRPLGSAISANEKLRTRRTFDIINYLFFASVYASISVGDRHGGTYADHAVKAIPLVRHKLNECGEKLGEQFESLGVDYAVPTIAAYNEEVAAVLGVELDRRIEVAVRERDAVRAEFHAINLCQDPEAWDRAWIKHENLKRDVGQLCEFRRLLR